MGYLVTKKTTVNGETKVTTYTSDDEIEAKRLYHSTLAQAYQKKEGLKHILCTLENDFGGQILKEYYFKPEETTVKEIPNEETIVEEVPNEG